MTRNWAVLIGMTCLLSSSTLGSLPLLLLPVPTALAQAADSRKTEADQLLQQGMKQYNTSQFAAARQSWQQALLLYQQIQDRWGEGQSLENLGMADEALGNYPRAIVQLEQSLAIARAIKDRRLEGRALGSLGTAYRGGGNYTKAIALYEQSLAIHRQTQERLEEGRVLSEMGDVYLSLGNTEQALALQRQSLQIAQAGGNYPGGGTASHRQGAAIALRNLGQAYEALGQYDRAIESEDKSLAIAREIGDRRGEAESLINLGVAYRTRGNVAKAMEYHQLSLEITRAIGFRRGEGSALGNLGMNYYARGNYIQAIQYHEQRLVIAREIGDREGEGNGMANLGNAYRSQGNYAKAIEFHERCLAITRAIRGKRGEGQCLGFLGLTYSALGNYSKAIDYYKQSLNIAVQINDQLGRAKSLGYLGRAYHDKGDYQEAIKYHQASLEMARQIQDRRGEGKSLGFLGNAYFAQGKYPEAIQYYESSLKIAQEVKDSRGQGRILGFIGNAYLAIGNYVKAIEYQEQSVAMARSIKDRKGEGLSLNSLGTARFRAGKLAEAEQDLYQAISVFESLREKLRDADKVSIADTQGSPYSTLQQLLIRQNRAEVALEIAERGRARAFAELLAKRTQGEEQITMQPLPIATIKQIARAQNATLVQYANLSNEQLLIYVIQPSGAVSLRQVDLKSLSQQKTSLEDLVLQARCLGLRACQQQGADRGNRTLTFNETPNNRLISLASTAPLKNEYLQRLHALLIEPVADLLPQKPSDRIIFLPQGALFLVPFAALQNPQGEYLIDRHTLTVAPSIQVLQLTRQQRQRLGDSPQGQWLLVGNPLMPKLAIPGKPPTQLTALPGAEQEVKSISKLLQIPALVGAQATKSSVLARMSQARIIHLATHGLLDDFSSGGVPGAIALAPDKLGEPNSGLLTANELLDLKLQAELVVLSACDTGGGRITGDGVIGLSRSLITAGVPSVIVSLWAVPDAPTADLMSRFYQNLQQGQDKATALRQAMLDTRKEHPDPIAWAAFTLIGEAE